MLASGRNEVALYLILILTLLSRNLAGFCKLRLMLAGFDLIQWVWFLPEMLLLYLA